MKEKRIAIVGIDTSHAVEFAKLMQSPDPGVRVVEGMRAVTAARFPSPFQTEEQQDRRQAELERLGVTMARTVEAAIADVDAVFLEINDPSLHLPLFEAVAPRGLPVFIDKPLAATSDEGRRIRALAEANRIPVWSSSSLRFLPTLRQARASLGGAPLVGHAFGALGKAAAGSDLVWYGVHAVEMLVASLGTGARTVHASNDSRGVILVVEYGDDRRGLVECLRGLWRYGGRLQSEKDVAFFDSGRDSPYPALLSALRDFVVDGTIPVPLAEAQEVLAILEAGDRSLASGKVESLDT